MMTSKNMLIQSEKAVITENLKRCQLPPAVKLVHNWNWNKV